MEYNRWYQRWYVLGTVILVCAGFFFLLAVTLMDDKGIIDNWKLHKEMNKLHIEKNIAYRTVGILADRVVTCEGDLKSLQSLKINYCRHSYYEDSEKSKWFWCTQ